VDFLECLKGLRPSRNYFLKLRVLSAKYPGTQGQRVNLQQAQEALCKIVGVYQILEFFFNRKPHGPSPRSGRCESVVQLGPRHGVRVLGLIGARRWWSRGTRVTRRCQRMSGGGEAVRRWRRAAAARAHRGSGGGQERAQERGGKVRGASGSVAHLL
jgi:hypothetical protein